MNDIAPYFLSALAAGMLITVIEQASIEVQAAEEPLSLFGTAPVIQNDDNVVNIVDFIESYKNEKYTAIKTEVLRQRAIESLGYKRLYIKTAVVIDLREYNYNVYSLLTRLSGFHENLDVIISCRYKGLPPEYVINLNISDGIAITGDYVLQANDIIVLQNCEVILPTPIENWDIIPKSE